MTTLDRYLLRSILGAVLLVMAVFLTLGGLFLFIGQQDDIGVGRYTALDASLFVLLNLPQQAWELLPISALIGTLVGLGGLARGSEITVMRTAGLSVWRIARAALLAGLLLAGFGAVLGEVLAPPMQQLARQEKAFDKFDNVSFAGRGGAWVRDGNLLVNVERQSGDAEFGGMLVFELDEAHRLRAVARAASATADAAGGWRLSQYTESRFDGDGVVARREPTRALRSNVSAEFVGIAAAAPNQLPSATLWRLVRHLQANGLDARPTLFALWSRIARTVAVPFGVLVAVPFVFGSLRSSGSGARTTIGLLIGIAFFLLQRMLESGAVVFDLDPVVLAWVPTALLATVALALIARTR
ncbi:MAG: LPS export ABC transporter permease LptG [Steroidobacteraceae bacterium]|nr:LPS export ABC transporter permease LptG [Steroidobacteraceae bacterium]